MSHDLHTESDAFLLLQERIQELNGSISVTVAHCPFRLKTPRCCINNVIVCSINIFHLEQFISSNLLLCHLVKVILPLG